MICVPLFFVALFFLPPYILTAVISIISAICAYELVHVIVPKSNDRIRIYVVFSAVLIPVGAYFKITLIVFTAVFLALMCLAFIESIVAFGTIRKVTFTQILIFLFAGTLTPLMLSSLVSLRIMPGGHLMALLPVISAFITDGGAYFTGILIGKHKAFPRISPNKTIEGCIGGLITSTLAILFYGVILLFTTLHGITFWALLIYGVIGAVLTQLGDLAFSLIKREYEIKDYGRILPGHGGLLDRFDSMIFTAPAIHLLVLLIPAIIIK